MAVRAGTGLRRDYSRFIHDSLIGVGLRQLRFEEAHDIAARVLGLYETGEFDVCTIIFNRFRTVLTQIVTAKQLIPLPTPADGTEATTALDGATYEFEPSEEEILADLLPHQRCGADLFSRP